MGQATGKHGKVRSSTARQRRRQHTTKQRTAALGARNSTDRRNRTTKAYQDSTVQHRTEQRGQKAHSTTPSGTRSTKHSGEKQHAPTPNGTTQRTQNTQRGETRQNTAPEGTEPQGNGQSPMTQHSRKQTTDIGNGANKQQSTTAHHHTTAQHHRTQDRGAEHKDTRHQTTGQDSDSTTETRHREPPGPTRRQQRTARPNSKHPNTTGNSKQPQPTPEGRESTAPRATRHQRRHETGGTQKHGTRNDSTRTTGNTGGRHSTAPKDRQSTITTRQDATQAPQQNQQHSTGTKRRTTAPQSTKRHSAAETSTSTQRDRATANNKTHHGRAPHRQKQPEAPHKG